MAWNSIWEEKFKQGWGKYPNENLVRFFFSHLSRRPRPLKVLEIGSGTGANLWFFAKEECEVYGIDGSETGVKTSIARLNQEASGWTGEIRTGDFCKDSLPWDDNFFDAVVDIEAGFCNPRSEMQKVYKECHRVLKPDGLLFVITLADGCYGINANSDAELEVRDKERFGIPYLRLTKLTEFNSLLSNFEIKNVKKHTLSLTDFESKNVLKEWLITGQKK